MPIQDYDALALVATTVKTANYTATANQIVPCDVSGGPFTVTLPTAPPDRTGMEIKIVKQAVSPNTLTVACGGSDVFNVAGGSASGTLTLLNQAMRMQYSTASAIWYVISTDVPLTQLDSRYLNQNTTGTAAGITGETISTSIAASTLAKRDTNANLSANTFLQGTTSTATAAGTTTLTIASSQVQVFTGATTQTVILPTTSVPAGHPYTIINQSSGVVTVRSSGANTIVTLQPNTQGTLVAQKATPTAQADWAAISLTTTVAEYTSTTTGIAVPAGITGVWIDSLIAPGGGGGSGRRGAAGTVRCGGGGGPSGAVISNYFIPAARLSSTVDLTLPAGGTGGAAQTVNDTNGNSGGAATGASFASGSFLVSTFSSIGVAAGGTASAGAGGILGQGPINGVSGGSASATGGVGGAGSNAVNGAPGAGGAGGGITSADSPSNGGTGGAQFLNYSTTPSAGVVGGASPGAGNAAVAGVAGQGGGGGAASITGAAQAGATPTGYGAGGGGGGSSLNGNNSGKGGDGGGAYCRLRWIYV